MKNMNAKMNAAESIETPANSGGANTAASQPASQAKPDYLKEYGNAREAADKALAEKRTEDYLQLATVADRAFAKLAKSVGRPTTVKLAKYRQIETGAIELFISQTQSDAGIIAGHCRDLRIVYINPKDTQNGEYIPLESQRLLKDSGLLGDKKETAARLARQSALQALKLALLKCGFISATGN